MRTFDKDAFKKAYRLTRTFISELMTGHDVDALDNLKKYIERAVEECASSADFINNLYKRTDISDDDKWELECHDAVIEHVFALYDLYTIVNKHTAAEEARHD